MKSSAGQRQKNLLSLILLIISVSVLVNLKAKYARPSPSELPRFMAALANASIRLETRMLIEWQLLTWVRPERLFVRVGLTSIQRTKSGTSPEFMKMKRPHKVPLSKEALRILENMQPISSHREWVFPSIKTPLTHMHEQTANAALIRMGLGVNWSPTVCDSSQGQQQRNAVSSGQKFSNRLWLIPKALRL